MTADELLEVLRSYEAELTGIVKRFIHKPGAINIAHGDDDRFRQVAGELIDLFNDALPRLRYAPQLAHELEQGPLITRHRYTALKNSAELSVRRSFGLSARQISLSAQRPGRQDARRAIPKRSSSSTGMMKQSGGSLRQYSPGNSALYLSYWRTSRTRAQTRSSKSSSTTHLCAPLRSHSSLPTTK